MARTWKQNQQARKRKAARRGAETRKVNPAVTAADYGPEEKEPLGQFEGLGPHGARIRQYTPDDLIPDARTRANFARYQDEVGAGGQGPAFEARATPSDVGGSPEAPGGAPEAQGGAFAEVKASLSPQAFNVFQQKRAEGMAPILKSHQQHKQINAQLKKFAGQSGKLRQEADRMEEALHAEESRRGAKASLDPFTEAGTRRGGRGGDRRVYRGGAHRGKPMVKVWRGEGLAEVRKARAQASRDKRFSDQKTRTEGRVKQMREDANDLRKKGLEIEKANPPMTKESVRADLDRAKERALQDAMVTQDTWDRSMDDKHATAVMNKTVSQGESVPEMDEADDKKKVQRYKMMGDDEKSLVAQLADPTLEEEQTARIQAELEDLRARRKSLGASIYTPGFGGDVVRDLIPINPDMTDGQIIHAHQKRRAEELGVKSYTHTPEELGGLRASIKVMRQATGGH